MHQLQFKRDADYTKLVLHVHQQGLQILGFFGMRLFNITLPSGICIKTVGKPIKYLYENVEI